MGVVLLAAWGCGGSSSAPSVSSSTEEATVRGTVSFKGAPPTGGEVTFDPGNINRKGEMPRTAKVEKDGTYTIKTLVGENSVSVHSPAIDKDPSLSSNSRIVDVKSGENNVPIELP
jgi:hypothetical protein